MSVLMWIRCALFPDKCLVCSEEGAVLCEVHRLEPSLIRENLSSDLALEQVFAVTNYQDKTSQQLVKKLKFSRQRSAAVPMIEALFKTINWRFYQDYVLIPIPQHWSRHYQRGFNQSLILAQGVSERTGLKVNTSLVRSKKTAQQARLGRQARMKNLEQGFNWRGAAVPPSKVILIDDVMTTGATVNAADLALKKAGSSVVLASTFEFQPEAGA